MRKSTTTREKLRLHPPASPAGEQEPRANPLYGRCPTSEPKKERDTQLKQSVNRRLSAKLEKRIRGVFHAKSAMAEPPVDPINAISRYAQPDNMVLLSFLRQPGNMSES